MNSADPVDYVPFEATVGPGTGGRAVSGRVEVTMGLS